MKQSFLLIFIALLFSSCAVHNSAMKARVEANKEQSSYLNKVREYPREFKIVNASAEEVWGRAQVFCNKYSSMKIQTVSNYIIETYNTRTLSQNDAMYGEKCDFAYSFSRSPGKDSTTFTVECRSNYGQSAVTELISDNEHFASYYMQTGEDIKYPAFVGR